ncbi:hypothetical protein EYF80_040939 [Liparis tanakae]|uniref:Uncharacterized protein n=1 Tax=Liparis tanakae TaxID=230148 RepID=A0A4Z2G7G7_9TELE|nr:hypothetical protein EYF80_040939 [Liparis tanakae]
MQNDHFLRYLQQSGLLMGEVLQLLQRLQDQSGFGEDQQALLCSRREVRRMDCTLARITFE